MRPSTNVAVDTTSMNRRGAERSTPSLRLFGGEGGGVVRWGRGHGHVVRLFVSGICERERGMERLQENVERGAIKDDVGS